MLHGKSHHKATGHQRNWKTGPPNKQTWAVHAQCYFTSAKRYPSRPCEPIQPKQPRQRHGETAQRRNKPSHQRKIDQRNHGDGANQPSTTDVLEQLLEVINHTFDFPKKVNVNMKLIQLNAARMATYGIAISIPQLTLTLIANIKNATKAEYGCKF